MDHWRRYLFGGLVAAGVALAALSRARAETFKLELKHLKPINEDSGPGLDPWDYHLRYVNSQDFFMLIGEQPEGAAAESEKEFSAIVKKQPDKYNSKHPLRAVAKLGSHKYAFVLDDKEPNSGNYDRLFFDKNHNGDLTDDEPIVTVQTGTLYARSTFPRVDLTVQADGASLDYAFFFSAYAVTTGTDVDAKKTTRFVSASLNAAAYREGDVTLDGKKRRVVVLDYNSNGRFGDKVRISEETSAPDEQISAEVGDLLLLDPSRETMGYAYFRPTATQASQYVSKLLNLEGKFYEVGISPAGDRITLSPSPLATGQVVNSSGPFHAVMYGEHGFLMVNSDGKNPARVPEGQWKLLSYTIDKTAELRAKEEADSSKKNQAKKPSGSLLGALAHALSSSLVPQLPGDAGPRYTVVTANATNRCPPVKVTRNAIVPLPFGPPYKPVVTVGSRDKEGSVQLQMSLVGSAGEICEDMMVNGRRPGTPRFTITDPKGKEVVSGSFEYG